MSDHKETPEEPRYEADEQVETFQMKVPTAGRKPIPSSPSVNTEELAAAIAKGFSDETNLQMYQSLCARYGTDACRRAFIRAIETPDDKIRKSRIGLFVHLARKYATGTK